jgi:exopolyphosphatase/guanosine-5'-triphosphate,3'-diphosphate pyrophosphatase
MYNDITASEIPRIQRLVCIMRLAVCFKHVEKLERLPDFTLEAGPDSLSLTFPPDWLEQHPLTARELATEQEVFGKLGLELVIS